MRWFRSALCATLLTAAGAGCLTTKSAPKDDPLKPRDLTPVTWLKAPAHAPVELVRDGQAKAVIYVADSKLRQLLAPPKRRNERPTAFSQLLSQLGESVRIATGAELPVVTNAPPAADQIAIVVGDCADNGQTCGWVAEAGYYDCGGTGEDPDGVYDIDCPVCTWGTCEGKECGDNGCGTPCGTCPEGLACVDGQCLCAPDCEGMECGEDGCGGSCGPCGAFQFCDLGVCLEGACEPDCAGKECGA